MAIEEAKIEALKAEHGEVFLVTAAGNDFAFRVPTGPECEMFQDMSASDKKKGIRALATLVRNAIVFPDKAEYDAIVSRRPMLPLTLGNEVLKVAGAAEDVEVKKA